MKKNGYTVVELLVVIAVFGIGYFIIANNISYAFSVDYEKELYNQTLTAIETNATIYAENNLKLFESEKDVYLTVGELAEKGLVLNNSEGKVSDPRDDSKTLNDLKVKLTYEDNKVTAKVLV